MNPGAAALPERSDPPRSYRMEINALPWLTANQRGGWARYHRLIADWRMLARYAARAAKLPALPAAHVIIELRFRRRHVRDTSNWAPTAKPIIDGLVDAGVLPDDRAECLIGPDLRVGPTAPGAGFGVVVVHIFPLAGRQA